MKIFGDRAPREEAEEFTRRRINAQCARIRAGEDWRDRFVLRSVATIVSHGNYGRRAWGVYLDDPEGSLVGVVIYNFGRTQLQYRRATGAWKNCIEDP